MKLSVEVYIKKNTLVASGIILSSNTAPFFTVSPDIAMTANEYVGFYIKITSGQSDYLTSNILLNSTTILTLQDVTPVVANDTFEIYRSDYQRLDLFKDEKISVTSQIGNANDIGKLYTDFSQSFSLPASKTNNEILSHWYENSVDNGYDHRMRYDAFIEIDTHRFRDGTIQLEKADKKDGYIQSYSVTFYGKLVQLKDVFKDEKLQSLDFTSFNHAYTGNEIRTRISSGSPFDIRYPLLGSEFKYEYQSGVAAKDITLITGAIKFDKLFPAITVQNIFLKIQAKYGITFTGSFFNLDQWKFLYLYLKPSLDLNFLTAPLDFNFTSKESSFPELDLNTDILTTNYNFPTTIPAGHIVSQKSIRVFVVITPVSLGIGYTLYAYKNGALFTSFTGVNTATFIIDIVPQTASPNLNVQYQYTFKLSANAAFTFTATMAYERRYFKFNPSTNLNTFFTEQKAGFTSQSTVLNIQISNYMPDMTIVDFITGIIKAFNLMIVPKPNNTYEFIPLEMYYNAGKILDITEYTYENEISINKPKLYKSINFMYEQSLNVLNVKYKGLYQQSYGDLIYNSERITENSTYEVKLPFENVLFELVKQGKQFQTASLINKDLQPYIPKPMLIYCNGLVTPLTGTDRIFVTNQPGAATQIVNYNRFSNEYDSMPTDLTHSQLMTMNFGNEQSSWLNVLAPQGLYYRHYKNFVDNLYSIKARLIKVKALLPVSLLGSTVTNGAGIPLGIALNDRLVIRNKRYLINSFTTDLTTGETDLELLTDFRGPDAASSVGYRFASLDNIQTDSQALTFEVVIYRNDYDTFNVKVPTSFLSYASSNNNQNDIVLTVTVPANASGIDRYDSVILDYRIGGVTQKLEYLNVTQTAI